MENKKYQYRGKKSQRNDAQLYNFKQIEDLEKIKRVL